MGFQPQNVLCPVRLDDDVDAARAQGVVEAACEFARAFGARLTIATIAAPDPPWPGAINAQAGDFTGVAVRTMTDVLRRRLDRAHGVLVRLEGIARDQGLDVRSLVVAQPGPVPDAIVDVAEAERCDLIVISDSGRHRMRHALGGTAERVAHRAKVPVLVVHPEGPPQPSASAV